MEKKYINAEMLQSLSPLDKKEIKKIITEILVLSEECMKEMETLIKNGEYSGLTEIISKLKVSMKMLGAEMLLEALIELENEIKAKVDGEIVTELFHSVKVLSSISKIEIHEELLKF